MSVSVIDPRTVRDLRPDLTGPLGDFQVKPAAWWADTSPAERAVYGHQTGRYHFPCVELVEWLTDFTAGTRAIEVCAGSGDLAALLGIPAYDNRMQEWPSIANLYAATGQPVTRYGANVHDADANAIARTLKPDIVVAAWMTHRYNAARHDLGGNQYGPDHVHLLADCGTLVFIGNTRTHAHHPLLALPHTRAPVPVFSRALAGDDFAAVFAGGRVRPG